MNRVFAVCFLSLITALPTWSRADTFGSGAISFEIEFVTIMWFDSWDAVKEFAGDDYEKAHYYPDDSQWLLEFEPTVLHYEVCVKP